MAASLLQACGLAELVAEFPEQYEQLAQTLASDPQKLRLLRAKLAANRHTAPLFRTEDFVRQLEQGFDEAWRRFRQGDTRDIQVPEL